LSCTEAVEKFRRGRELAGEDEELFKTFRRGLADAYSQRGHQQRYIKKFKEAAVDLSQALRLNSELYDDFYYRALTYLKLGEEKLARNDFTQFLRYSPDELLKEDAQIRLTAIAPKNNSPEQANFLAKEGSRLNAEAANLMQPRESETANPDRAVALYNQALENFNKALELAPKDLLARMGLLATLAEQAACYFAIQEYDLAIENLSQALTIKPNPWHLFRRGEAYRMAGQTELAKADFNEYLKKGDNLELKEKATQYLSEKPKAGSTSV